MKIITLAAALSAAAGLLALVPASAAADMTTAGKMSCLPTKGGRCKPDGTCKWREARAKDRVAILVLDMGAKTATMTRGAKSRQIGIVVADKVEDGVRRVTVKRKADSPARHDMVMLIKKDGSFSGWRAQKRVRFEGNCKAG